MALRNRIRVEVEKPKNKILNFPVKVFVTMVFLGIFVIAAYTALPYFKEMNMRLTQSKLQMLPGTKDIPLFPGLQPESPPSNRYLIPKNTVDEVHRFYKDNLPSFGWTMQEEGEGTGNGAEGSIKGKASFWFNEAKLSWLRVNLYEYQDGRRQLYLEDDYRNSDKLMTNWQASPEFDYPVTLQNGEKYVYQLQGVKERLAFTAPNQFKVNIADKHLWFFWGKKEELLGQKVKIIGLSKKTGQIFNVFSSVIPRDYEGQSVDGIHINMPSGLSLPSIGLWRLYVIVGDKYFDSVIVDVN